MVVVPFGGSCTNKPMFYMHVDNNSIVRYQYLSILVAVCLFFTVASLHEVDASTGLNKSIGIALSKTCVTMTKNNFTSNCPTPEWLVSLGLDTSNRYISGDFVYIDNYLQREHPKFLNHYRFYDFEKDYNIFVDPPGDMRDRIPMIIIESSLPEYKVRGESFLMENNTRVTYKDRFVDDDCRNATLSAENILSTLPDTIRFMRNGCDPSFTTMETRIVIEEEKSFQDITTTQKYKDEQRLQFIKENCIKEYGVCDE